MTELEKHLLGALEAAHEHQELREAELRRMFEVTRQENQALREAFKNLLDNITAADKKQSESWNSLVKHVRDLNTQLQDFERQNSILNKQLSSIQEQLLKLKKWANQNRVTAEEWTLVCNEYWHKSMLWKDFLKCHLNSATFQ